MRKYIAINTPGTLAGALIVSLENVRSVNLESEGEGGGYHGICIRYEEGETRNIGFTQYESAEKTFLAIGIEFTCRAPSLSGFVRRDSIS